MRITDLNESYKYIESEDWVLKNCSEAIESFIKNNKCIYRGTSSISRDGSLMVGNKTERKAANATMNIHTRLINSGALGDFPKREIILTSSKKKAEQYGSACIALPVNGSNVACVGSDDIYTGFPYLPRTYLGAYYNSLTRLFEELLYIKLGKNQKVNIRVLDKYVDTVSDLKKILSELCGVGYISDEDYENLSELTGLRISFIKDIVDRCDVNTIIEPFMQHNFSNYKISNIIIEDNMEYWTDSPTVLIYEYVIEEKYPELYSLLKKIIN